MRANLAGAMQPPFVVHPLTALWRQLDVATCLTSEFFEFFKLVEMALVHVLGNVEDEYTFSTLNFLKSKLRNNLEDHLQLVVGMFSQRIFTLENFLYDATFTDWLNGGERSRYGFNS